MCVRAEFTEDCTRSPEDHGKEAEHGLEHGCAHGIIQCQVQLMAQELD